LSFTFSTKCKLGYNHNLNFFSHIFKLNGKVPYLLNRGNHDTRSGFNDTFQGSVYENQIMGRYDEGVENTWQSISVNGQKYLIMALDYGARYNVLTWASEVIEQHPDHNVIITTHAYLNEDGTTLDSKEADCPPISEGYSTGELMWNQFVKKHENIVLVLCGHISSDKIVVTQTKGEHGNTVTQMLINPQDVDIAHGPTGLVSMFYFSADGKSLQVEYYSTVKQQYFLPENQFTVTLDVVDPSKVVNPISSSTEQTSSSKKQTSSVIDKPSSVPQQNSSNQISKTPASVFDIVSMQDSFATISKDMTSSNIPSDITVGGTSSNSDNNGSSKINVWLIIGIVLSIVIIATGGAVGMICWKKKPPRKSPPKW